jgi:hypothetical protein
MADLPARRVVHALERAGFVRSGSVDPIVCCGTLTVVN